MNFETNLSNQVVYLENERAYFKMKQKEFFIIFKGLSMRQIIQIFGRLESNFKRKISSNK